jgi:hypothetical protein
MSARIPDPQSPVWVELTPCRWRDEQGQRLIIVLNAPGCLYSRATGGCTNCAFPNMGTRGRPVSAVAYHRQVVRALQSVTPLPEDLLEIDLYNSGSFLADEEVPPDARRGMLAELHATTDARRILIESRPEYVTREALEELAALIRPRELEVGIGLESADRRVREELIRKGFGWEEFVRAARVVAEAGCRLLVYVLLKPLGLSEDAAVLDAVTTGRKVFALAGSLDLPVRIALEPCFVMSNTPLGAAYTRGEYRPPTLWSVREVVEALAPLGELIVGLSEEGLQVERTAGNCPACTGRMRRALARFNLSGDLEQLRAVDCPCRAESQGSAARGSRP